MYYILFLFFILLRYTGYIFYLIGSVLMIIMSNDTISFCHLANNNTHHNNATSVFQEPCSPGVFLILICM